MMFNIGFRSPEVPCRECAERTVECHGSCKKYSEWKIARDDMRTEINKKRRADRDYKTHIADYVAKAQRQKKGR